MSLSRLFLVLYLLLSIVPCPKGHEQYSTLGDLLHWYAHSAQAHPHLVRYTELREPGFEHAVLPLATFTNYSAGEAQQKSKSSVLLVFGEHARELITCEVGLWFSRVLLGDTAEIFSWRQWLEAFAPLGISPDDVSSTVKGWVQRILDNLVVKVLPIENVDGRQVWEGGNLCLRKTSKGVDLNRNYPFAFASEPPHSEMFGGPHPFSEAQSRLVARIALDGGRVPKAYINVHSGEWAVYSGWDSKAAIGPGLPADLSDLLIKSGDVCRCQAGPAGAVSNYLAFGTGMDFMYTQLGVPYALTYEVYGNSGAVGNGEPGRLPDGIHNKPLSDYPYVTDDGIAHVVPHIDTLLPYSRPHQHQQHQHSRDALRSSLARRRGRMSRSYASKLHRSAGDVAGKELEEQQQSVLVTVAAGGDVAAANGSGSDDPSRGLESSRGDDGDRWINGVDRGGDDATLNRDDHSGRRLLDTRASEPSSSSSSSSVSSSSFEVSQFPASLGGRSMRHLAAVSTATAAAAMEKGTADTAGGASRHMSGTLTSDDVSSGARRLLADPSASSSADGPILGMVRQQPSMHQGCFDMFNPPPGPVYRDVVSRWVVILLMTLDHVANPAHPLPSPHSLPGTVLVGGAMGPWTGPGSDDAKAYRDTASGRRQLMETSASTEMVERKAAKPEVLPVGSSGAAGVGQTPIGNVADFAAVKAEVVTGVSGLGMEGAAVRGDGGKVEAEREDGDPYGSASFELRAQQGSYEMKREVDPEMQQHSLVVLLALCCLAAVFLPWLIFASRQTVRQLPPQPGRRNRQQLTATLVQPPMAPPPRMYT